VIPFLDEADNLAELHRRLSAVVTELDGEAEFIFVDDGSTDGGRLRLLDLRRDDPRSTVICLSRNFGHQLAITAGVDVARGDAVVIMDADLQDPPEVVPELAARWREGYEVVHAVRATRQGEGRFKRATAHLFYRILNRATDVDLPLDAGDFRLIDRRVADIVRGMREPNRYLRGMFGWVGFQQTSVAYERAERSAGETKFSLVKMLGFAADGLISFSTVPLRIALSLGFLISALAFTVGIAAATIKVTGGFTIPGWASLAVLVSFFSGVQLVLMGAIGLYVGRTYEQGKGRPLYLISEIHGLDGTAGDDLHSRAVIVDSRWGQKQRS